MNGNTGKTWVLSLMALAAWIRIGAAAVLIDVDASKLPAGPLSACRSEGAAGGELVAGGPRGIVVEGVAGRKAVTFAGSDWLVSSFAVPAGVTGSNAYTVAVWALNPSVATEECLVMWARRGTEARAAQLNFGQSRDFGAVTHWGRPDMGYDGGAPSSNTWHHIAVTFTGGANGEERVYVDGKLNAAETKTLNLWPNGRVHLGSAGGERSFSGSLAAVQVFERALTAGDVAGLAARPARDAGEALVSLDAADLADGRLTEWTNRGTLGGAFTRASMPLVTTVAGRPALLFEGSQTLITSAALPPELRGGGPFTLEVTAINPAIDRSETLAGFSASNMTGAAFNFGRSLSSGAFSAGPETGVAFESRPDPDAWHHLAWTYSGVPDSVLTVFVDGERAGGGKVPFTLDPDGRLVLGGRGWDGSRDRFSGAIARLRVHDTAIPQYDLRRGCGLVNAYNPEPKDRSVADSLSVALRWERGAEGVTAYCVYFGADRAAVEARAAGVRQGELPTEKTTFGPVALRVGASYAWLVDQLDAAGRDAGRGTVWTFSADAGLASEPRPRDRTANTPAGALELRWRPGRFAVRQSVYFGTDKEAARAAATNALAPGLDGDAGALALPAPLQPGTRYFWRVDCDNGDQPPSKGAVWAFRTRDTPVSNDLTFFAVSDTHYTLDPGSQMGPRLTIDVMNWMPGEAWPGELGGGAVRTPRGVLHCGDMLNDGAMPDAAAAWRLFTADFGVDGEGRLCYPVFEAIGNHDAGDGFPPQAGVKARNRLRPGLGRASSNGLHYAWDWERVHFVCLNKYSGSGRDPDRPFNQAWNDPTHSLEFLADDLAKSVGESGRPVILYQHYGWDGFSAGWGWWSEKDRTATWEAIKAYNVVAYLHGHTHAATFMKWDGKDFHKEGQQMPARGLDVIGCGSGNRGPDNPGGFMVFQLTGQDLRVAERNGNAWGAHMRIPIRVGSLEERLAADPAR